jgi:metal-responsive CopG/Arc/MetJ family transcriptional regulator
MEVVVDIGESQVEALDELAKADSVSRASLIRRAVDDYLARRRVKPRADAFGLWGKRKVQNS